MFLVIPSKKFSASFAVLLLLLVCQHSGIAQEQESEKKEQAIDATTTKSAEADPESIDDSMFQPKDLFQLEFASDAQISPDGSTIVYRRKKLLRHHERSRRGRLVDDQLCRKAFAAD